MRSRVCGRGCAVVVMAGDFAGRVDAMAARARSRVDDEAAAAAERDRVEAERVEAKRQRMREMMPHIAGLVDAFRECGVEVKVLMAEENGRRVVAKGYVDDCER
jgi:hypothetical protein